VIGDDFGRVIARGRAGGSNHVSSAEGRDGLRRVLRDSLDDACRSIGLNVSDVRFEAAFLGFTGGDTGKRAVVDEVVHASRTCLSDDLLIAHAGALAGGPGIVTNAGTGSFSWGRDETGQTARAGGWGFAFGDEASAFDLVRQALRAALRYEEGWGPPTCLHEMLRHAVGRDDIRLVQRRLYSAEYTTARVAGLAPLVTEAAQQGDAVACQMLETAAQQLVNLTDVVRRRLFASTRVVAISYVGGVFRSDLLRSTFLRLLIETGFFQPTPPVYEPAVGALIEAYRSSGRSVSIQGKLRSGDV
jgi:N-acetylglucosamine kinase-like BadF-type ATPase